MKTVYRFIYSILILLPFAVVACDDYDDKEINERIDQIEGRVTALETIVAQLNSSLTGLVTSIDALKNQDKVVSVNRLPEGNGWEIVFDKAGSISVFDGKNGVNGTDGTTHQIGVRKDEDDLYYWTIDGEWLIADGSKVPATAEVMMPQIKVDKGKFLFSVNGTDWVEIGDAGTAEIGIISDVKDGDDAVVFTLSDNSQITIPKVQSFELCVESTSVPIIPGAIGVILYEIKGADENTVLKVFPCDGYDVEVQADSYSAGAIGVMPKGNVIDAELLVIAISGKGIMSGKLFKIETGVLYFAQDAYTIGAEGGIVNIKVNTNVHYMLDWHDSWIAPVETKAPHVDEVPFSVQANPSKSERRANITLVDDYGAVYLQATIIQEAKSDDSPQVQSGGTSDFDTFVGDAIDPSPVSRNAQTTNGWEAKNVYLTETTYQWKSLGLGHIVPALSGDTREIGVLTSPMIEGGCGNLTIEWGTYSNSAWRPDNISATVEVMNDNKELVCSFVVEMDKNEIVEETVYTYTKELNQSGPYYLKITNNSTTKSALNSTFAIVSVSWTGYSE